MAKDVLHSEAFTKIADESSKLKIYQQIVGSSQNMQFKESKSSTNLVLLRPLSLVRSRLICKLESGESLSTLSGDGVISFQVQEDKYYASLNFEIHDDLVHLDLDQPLFHLQRREDFRLKIPESLKVKLELSLPNQTSSSSNSLLDLSSGGLKIETDLNLQLEDKAVVALTIENFAPIKSSVRVKFQKASLHKKNFYQLGLQFESLTEKEKNNIFLLVMSLYKELFKKL